MANTLIQVKRSTTTNQPGGGTLSAGEMAYSYSSNVLFIGSSGGNDVLAIGGKYYIDFLNTTFALAQSAYNTANSGLTVTSAFNKANSANYYAYLVDQNTAAAFAKANAANLAAGTAFDSENVTRAIAIAAYGNSNTKFSSSGGTINGDVNISGNLSLTGATTFINVASYIVNDPLLYIAGNNYTSDIVDIGFVANYVNATGSNVHTGFFRDAGSKEYYVFEGYDEEPHNNVIDPAGNNFTISVLNATLRTSNIILGGINAISWIRNSYDTANIAVANVNYVNTAMQTAYGLINNHSGAITTANNTAVAAFLQANNVGGAVTTANLIATSAFAAANAASAQAANADFITSGTLVVGRGGTGVGTFTTNGILYGNTTGPLKVTAAGTEGQVLQASSTGVPNFAMLDGGSF
jgi:hypothetical protein